MRGWLVVLCLSGCWFGHGGNGVGDDGTRPDAAPPIDACVPVTCEQLSANCDMLPDDGCGHPLDCGACDAPATCGGQGQGNVCAIPEDERTCTAGWCWEAPSPLPFDPSSLFAVSATDVWAVGTSGVIMHYDGTRWALVPSGTTADLYDIWMASATNGWIVGAGGKLFHYDGTSWAARASNTTAALSGVWGDAANDVWFVGANVARRWNGSSIVTPLGSVPLLANVYVAPGGKVFAVGEGKVWAYGGTGWTEQTPDPGLFESYTLDHIAGTGAKAFAVGRSYSFGSGEELIFQWDGASTWTSKDHPGDPEWTDAFADGGEVFGVSDESIIDLDTFDRTLGPASTAMGAAAGADGQVFVATSGGQLWEGQGGTYTTQSYGTRDTITAIGDIAGTPWFGTAGGDVLEWRSGLVAHHLPDVIAAVAGTARDDVWAATRTSVYHFDGTAWHDVDGGIGFTNAMLARPDDVLLFGYHIWERTQDQFTEVTIPTQTSMLWTAADDLGGDVYAIGVDEAATPAAHVITRTGGTWSELPLPGLADGCAIAVAAADDIWIGGGDGTTGEVAHWDGSAWTTTMIPGTASVCALEVANGEVYAGSAGDVHHWSAGAWTVEHALPSGAVSALRASGDSIWLAGEHGAVLRR